VALGGEDLEGLPALGSVQRRQPKAKAKSKLAARERLKQQQTAQRAKLPTAPQPQMLSMQEERGTLVDWLPYDSIDVVFNSENVWANHQNHHPACISYDFEAAGDSSSGWSKLLKNDEERQSFPFDYINADVLIDPALKPEKLTGLECEMVNEMEENMRLYRQKRGYDTWWDKHPDLLQQLETFLDIHEKMRRIDVDLCPIWQKRPDEWSEHERYLMERLRFGQCCRRYNKYGTPFNQGESAKKYKNYLSEQAQSYEQLLAMVKTFVDRRRLFPTRKGKEFTGMPFHFSTVEKDYIRAHLTQDPEYVKLLERPEEGLEFTVHCKIFGLLGGIQSTWLYFGVQAPMEERDAA